MSIIGDVVFPGAVSGILLDYKNNKTIQCTPDVIIYSENLTPEIALFAINNNIKGIITSESSFATHGANIIRAYFNTSNKKLVWVTGVDKNSLLDLFGKKIEITTAGVCLENSNHNAIKKQRYNLKPLKKRSIIEYNITKGFYEICYWPHRRYDTLTFSLMKDGLKRNFNLLGYYNATILHRADGSIWFCDVPTVSTLSECARNITYASGILERQIRLYEELYCKASCVLSAKELCDIIIDFFSIFLLFHDTYEDVLCDAMSLLSQNLSQEELMNAMNHLMTCNLDEWMLKNRILLEKRKSLLSDENIVPLPKFNIMEDITESRQKLENFFQQANSLQLFKNNSRELLFYKDMFVAKEWKFVMVKVLFSRFSNVMKMLFDSCQIESISNHDYNHLIDLLV